MLQNIQNGLILKEIMVREKIHFQSKFFIFSSIDAFMDPNPDSSKSFYRYLFS
jgi:hypothetical protein